MSYRYEDEREKLFTEDGVDTFIKVRTKCMELLQTAGAFQMGHAIGAAPDSWFGLACVDRLVEQGLVKELYISPVPAGQHRTFVNSGLVKR